MSTQYDRFHHALRPPIWKSAPGHKRLDRLDPRPKEFMVRGKGKFMGFCGNLRLRDVVMCEI